MFNRKAYDHAMSLIRTGKVNSGSDWSFDAADGNAILGDPPDWDAYARWFLLKDPDANPQSKAAYKYPYGKDGKVYRAALTAIRQRAGQQGEDEVFEAAGRLLEEIDSKEQPTQAKLSFVSPLVGATSGHEISGPQAGTPAPPEFQLFRYGWNEIEGEGAFLVDDQGMAQAVAAFDARGLDMVVDYEHQTLGGAQAPAAGWIKKLVARGKEGLWAAVEWTQKARDYLTNREYRYYSPVFWVDNATRRLVKVSNVALTNDPKMNGIMAIVAKKTKEGEMELLKKIAKLLGLAEDATEDKVIEAIQAKILQRDPGAQSGSREALLKKVAKLVGLAEDTGEDAVLAAVAARRSTDSGGVVASAEVLQALGLKDGADRSEILATIHALKQTPNLIERVAKLEQDRAVREKDELVGRALKEGKITPAQKEWAEKYATDDAAGFRIFLAKAPQIVPVGQLHVLKDEQARASGSIGETQLTINRLLGVSEEMFKKYYPARAN